MVLLRGGAVSYERGTPVGAHGDATDAHMSYISSVACGVIASTVNLVPFRDAL